MATNIKGRVGFIGLGIMGQPMARHLADAGMLGSAFDRSQIALRSFTEHYPKVRGASCPSGVAESTDIVITMLPDGKEVRDVALGDKGLCHAMRSGSLLIDTSSSQPWLTRETGEALSASGIAMIDAPVSGARWGAEAAELVFMVGGAPEHIERAQPIFELLGREVFRLGPLGSGHTMKCINNTVTAVVLQAVLEGLALGTVCGLDSAAMNRVFNESTAGSWITRTHIEQRILSGSFDDPFRLSLMRKDIDIATKLASERGVNLPITETCGECYRSADEEAGEGRSISEMGHWMERRTGVIFS